MRAQTTAGRGGGGGGECGSGSLRKQSAAYHVTAENPNGLLSLLRFRIRRLKAQGNHCSPEPPPPPPLGAAEPGVALINDAVIQFQS